MKQECTSRCSELRVIGGEVSIKWDDMLLCDLLLNC